ncbi:hypothetical protein ALI144C_30915 [Actinosynnema sp. ALI-1.44]|uniref:hypothetical protein n=1 Tax=Actinosynnema sp. ALI-1.44 TaxID=1933779 RepID=UPI00097BF903|nr:hypothetical protein [Actinosynnema sp. ALI-1.44]ONI77842.1 hypothetical protein ALI144C_30915 [Actinosynnema sp. ALI-1.44]
MRTSETREPRGKRYYYLAGLAILAVIALGIVFIDQAPWLLIIGGCLMGGFLVDTAVAWSRYRRSTTGNSTNED